MRGPSEWEKVKSLRRRAHNIVMIGHAEFNCNLSYYVEILHSLTIRSYSRVLSLNDFTEFLIHLPNLKTLTVSKSCIYSDENTVIHRQVVLKLVELQCDVNLLDIIEGPSLKVLNLYSVNNSTAQNHLNTCEFLRKHKTLESLTLNDFDNDFFQVFKEFCFDFQLKSFALCSTVIFNNYKELFNILEAQNESLNSLKIELFSNDQCKVVIGKTLKYILGNSSNLTTLEFNTKIRDFSSLHEVFPLPLAPFVASKIENFYFCDIFYSIDDTKLLFDMLPNLKRLSIKTRFKKTSDFLTYAAEKEKLKSLTICNYEIFRWSPWIDY